MSYLLAYSWEPIEGNSNLMYVPCPVNAHHAITSACYKLSVRMLSSCLSRAAVKSSAIGNYLGAAFANDRTAKFYLVGGGCFSCIKKSFCWAVDVSDSLIDYYYSHYNK